MTLKQLIIDAVEAMSHITGDFDLARLNANPFGQKLYASLKDISNDLREYTPVWLASGGPRMTIMRLKDGKATCAWYNEADDTVHHSVFDVRTITTTPPQGPEIMSSEPVGPEEPVTASKKKKPVHGAAEVWQGLANDTEAVFESTCRRFRVHYSDEELDADDEGDGEDCASFAVVEDRQQESIAVYQNRPKDKADFIKLLNDYKFERTT